MHNETGTYLAVSMSAGTKTTAVVNIYSHLFGALLFVSLPFYNYNTVYSRYGSAQLGDVVVFSTFFFGVAISFFLSAWYVFFPSNMTLL